MGATINVGNIDVASNVVVNFSTSANTLGLNSTVRTFSVGSGAVLDLNSQAISTAAGSGITKSGAGILALGGSVGNGGFTLSAGTVVMKSDTAVSSGLFSINGGTITANASRTVSSPSSIAIGGNFTIGGATTGVSSGNGSVSADISFNDAVALGALARTITIGGTGTYTFSGTMSGGTAAGLTALTVGATANGTLVLATTNNYTGKTLVSGGTVRGSGEGIFGANPGSSTADQITLDGGTFQASASLEFNSNRGITLGANGGTFNSNGNTITLTTVVTGSGSLTKSGAGTLSLNAAHNYAGSTAINGGTVALAAANAIGGSGAITFGGGTLQFSASNTTDYSARFTGATNQAYSFDTNGQTVNFANPLTATTGSSLAKLGTGTLTLNGTQTYAGATSIAAGTLQLGATAVLPTTTAVSVGTSGGTTGAVTLSVNGTSQTIASLTLLGGGTSATNSGGVNLGAGGTLTVNGPITYETGANNRWPSQITGAGSNALNLGGATRTITVWDNNNSGYDLQIAVPIESGGINFVGSGGAPILSLAASNTFIGGVTIGDGVLQLGNAGALNSTTPNAVAFASGSSGVLRLNGNSITIAGLSTNATPGTTFVESNSSTAGTDTLTVAVADATTNTFAGTLRNGSTRFLALTKTGNGTLVLSGDNFNMTGAIGVTAGTLVLSGGNGNTGATSIASGATLQIGNGGTTGALGTTSSITNNGTLVFNRSNVASGVNAISGSGTVRNAGTGTLTLGNANSYTGPTVIEAGTLAAGILANGGVTSSIGASTSAASNLVLAGGSLSYNGTTPTSTNRDYTFGNATTATGGGFDAAGTTAANTFTLTGNMTAVNTASGTQTLTLSGTNTGANTLSGSVVDSSGTALTAIAKSGAGTWVLSGTGNTFTGGVSVSAGTLRVGSSNALNANAVTLTGGSLDLNATDITVGNLSGTGGSISDSGAAGLTTLNVNQAGTTSYTGTIANGASRTVAVVKQGTGTLTLGGANTHTGGTSVTAGTLTVGNANALGPNTATVSTSGTGQLNLNGTNVTVGGLSSSESGGAHGSIASSSAATLTVNASTDSDYAGTIGGSVALNKTGAGTLTLGGTNSHAGTTVNAGTLVAQTSTALGAPAAPVVVAGGASLYANNGAQIANNISLGSAVSSSPVTETFDTLGSGVPSGWSVRTGATATSLGTATATNLSQVLWASTTGQFANYASGALGTGANDAAQNAATNRALGVRPTGSFGDPGAAFVYSANTTGSTITSIGLDIQLLDSQTRSNTYFVQYSTNGGTVWSTFTGGAWSDPGAFNVTPLTLNNSTEMAAISGKSNLMIRIATLAGSTGGGSRDTVAIDNFTIGYQVPGSGGTLGTLTESTTATYTGAITLQNSSTLTAANNSTVAISGAIGEASAGLGVQKTGSGTVVLAADNTYSGTTTVSAGTLQIGSGGTTGSVGTGAIVNNAAVVFNRSDDVTLNASKLSGTGSLTQNGATSGSTLTLTGVHTYSGTTNVTAGKLIVNGTLSAVGGDVAVSTGAAIGGSGTIGRDVSVGGTLAPGNSAGTLTIVGDLALASSSTSAFELTYAPGEGLDQSSSTTNDDQVVGLTSLSLGGALSLTSLGGDFTSVPIGTSWTLFSGSGTPMGAFASIGGITLGAGRSWGVEIVGTNVLLQVVPEPAVICGALLVAGNMLRRRRVSI